MKKNFLKKGAFPLRLIVVTLVVALSTTLLGFWHAREWLFLTAAAILILALAIYLVTWRFLDLARAVTERAEGYDDGLPLANKFPPGIGRAVAEGVDSIVRRAAEAASLKNEATLRLNELLEMQVSKATEGIFVAQASGAAEQEQTKLAMLNLLEDLEAERNASREEAARMDTVVESIADGVCVVAIDGRVRLINPTAEEMFGLRGKEVVGQHYSTLLSGFEDEHGRALPPEKHPVTRALGSRERISGRAVIAGDGRRTDVSFRAATIVSGPDTLGAVIVFRDVTDEARLERARNEFISVVSHQLRTPLTTIRWYAESMANGDLGTFDEASMEAVRTVMESSQRMISLINTLLNSTRVESGRLRVVPVPCSLPDLLKEVWAENRFDAERKHLSFQENFDPAVPTINADRDLIKVVVQNLIGNAVRYTPEGGTVSVAASVVGPEVVVSVRDTGIGIPEAQKQKVFQKMFRADNAAKMVGEGTGLGLYVSKSVVETAGGRLWFESKEGVGSAFFFSLPLTGMAAREGDRTLVA